MVGEHTVYDCCFFNDELDLLELRILELEKVVDRFVIVEADKTLQGNAKPFHLKDNMARFALWQDRIIRIEVTDMPGGSNHSAREYHQRDAVLRGLTGAKPDDWVLLSDVDEIPKPEIITTWQPELGPRKFFQMLCYYWFNCIATNINWGGTLIATMAQLSMRGTPTQLRSADPTLPMIPDHGPHGGWHFSYTGGVAGIKSKLASYAHQNLGTPEITNEDNLRKSIQRGEDLFHREGLTFDFVPLDSRFPLVVRNNPGKWVNFIASASYHENWYNNDQLALLRRMAAQVKHLSGAIMEFGCWEGRSTVELANECHPETILAIDTWQGNYNENPDHPSVRLAKERDVRSQFDINVRFQTKGNVQAVQRDCHLFMADWQGPIKFAHIDADHDYKSVRGQLDALLRWIVPDGMICGDDFKTANATRTDLDGGVERAVRELLPEFEHIGNFWFWHKPPDEYNRRCITPSDINEHLPLLRSYAEKCSVVAEFGVRTGNSTVALLEAHPESLLLYDLQWHPECAPLNRLQGKTCLRFFKQDSRTADLPEVDMLHIDTEHTYAQLLVELFVHGNKVRKFIAMHDTTTFGTVGSDGGKGLNFAIEEFLKANPHWKIAEIRTNNNGMTILERH